MHESKHLQESIKGRSQTTRRSLALHAGVHRPTVSVAAAMLQKAGFIHYVRGVITVQNRKGLERASCGCYRSISKEYERLLSGA